jgi:hypothetical protein
MRRWNIRAISVVAAIAACGAGTRAYAQAQPPAGPQVFIDTTYPTQTGTTIPVHAGGNLQQAIDTANPGDTIVIDKGIPLSGTFTLRNKPNPNGQWIVIRTSSALFDPPGRLQPGTRVNGSASADTNEMPHLAATATNQPTFKTDTAASHYRLVGLDVAAGPGPGTNVLLLGSDVASSASDLATDIVIDRCYVHGSDTGDTKRGVAANGIRLAVIDSYVANIHIVNDESQGIAAWNSPGPLKISNNHIEGGGEVILFGGADPGIPPEIVAAFGRALDAEGVTNELVTYEGAPHSFFDRAFEQHREACDDAWRRVLRFIEANR